MVLTESTLKRLRIEAGLTQRELAELAGVSQAHISKIERGSVDPRLSTVNKILQVLTTGKGKKCRDIMTKKVIFAKPDDRVLKVSKLMMKHAISQVPVMEDGKCIGTVTEESIIRNLSSTIAEEYVRRVMQSPLPSVPEETDISLIEPLLGYHPGVLIVRAGEIIGIITRSDLLKIVS
ncbi:MAG: CBS domain-containing protein [Candidatus Bathyarchaeia archaeon]